MPKKYLNVVINYQYGGFSVSNRGLKYMQELARKDGVLSEREIKSRYRYAGRYLCRHDKYLVQAVRDLGKKCNGMCATLCIEQIEYKYKHKYYCADFNDGYEELRIDRSSEDPKNIFCKKMYALPDPGTMTLEECRAKLLEIYALKEEYLIEEPESEDESDDDPDAGTDTEYTFGEDNDEEDDDEDDISSDDESYASENDDD